MSLMDITVEGHTFKIDPDKIRAALVLQPGTREWRSLVVIGVIGWMSTPQGTGFWDRVTDPNPPETMVIQAVEALVTFLRAAEKAEAEAAAEAEWDAEAEAQRLADAAAREALMDDVLEGYRSWVRLPTEGNFRSFVGTYLFDLGYRLTTRGAT